MKASLSRFLLLAVLIVPISISAPAQKAFAVQPETNPDLSRTTTAPIGPSGIITLVAGNGYIGDTGNGGLATSAQLASPQGVAVDSVGNVYIADQYAAVVRKVAAATGIISNYAGTGFGGYSGDGGPAISAQIDEPLGLALDAAGDLYIADSRNNVIREVNAKTGIITTVAGDGQGAGAGGANGCGSNSAQTGPALYFSLCAPNSVALDSAGNLYILDAPENTATIREVNTKTGVISVVAGGYYGYAGDGGKAVNAKFADPTQLAIDSSNNIYIADWENCAVRMITAKTGIITSLVGKPAAGGFGGTCSFSGFTGAGGPASKAVIGFPNGIAVDAAGNIYISDEAYTVVYMIAAGSKNIYTIAGSLYSYGSGNEGVHGFQGYGGPATQAQLDIPGQLTTDAHGNLYGADPDSAMVFKVSGPSALPTTAPVISPTPAQFSGSLTVTITNPVANSTLYYTLDGTVPTTASTKYTGPIVLNNESAIVTAFSVPNVSAVRPDENPETGASSHPETGTSAQPSVASDGLYGCAPPAPTITPNGGDVTTTTEIKVTHQPIQSFVKYPNEDDYYSKNGNDPVTGIDQPGIASSLAAPDFTLKAGSAIVTAATCLKLYGIVAYSDCIWSRTVTAQFTVASAAVSKPAVTTQPASAITAAATRLNGTVNPHSAATQYWIVYWEAGASLANTSPMLEAGAGNAPVPVSVPQSGLKANTTYYYRLEALNAKGTAQGAVMNFKTP